MLIHINGEQWSIKDGELNEADGICDITTKAITISDRLLKQLNGERDVRDISVYRNKVIRHECVHALMLESGISQTFKCHTEEVVDWVAMMYPKLKKIFEELNIE